MEKQFKSYSVLGVKVDACTMGQALDCLEGFLEEQEPPQPRLVVTVGPEMVMRAQENAEFKELVNGADLVVPDGTGILWAGSSCGVTFPERVAGVELIVSLAKRLAARGHSLYLLGAAPGVAEKAAAELRRQIPGLNIVGTHDGYFKDGQAVAEEIGALKPDVIYVALGSPAQEKWVRAHGRTMGIKLGIGVGGSFDVISGLKKRAPSLFIKLRLEWLYRFLCEPSRMGRMAAIPRYMLRVRRAGKQAVVELN